MSEDSDHGALQAEALELWESGDLGEAGRKCEVAIALCPEDHWALGNYRGAYAGVLAALGLIAEAGIQRELVLKHELASGEGDDAPNVAMARYFLGLNNVEAGEFQRALDAVMPSLVVGARVEPLLRSVQAQALAGLGRMPEARSAATAALASARSDGQRSKLAKELAHLLDAGA